MPLAERRGSPAQPTISGRHVCHLMGTVFSVQLDEPVPAAALRDVWIWLRRVDTVFSTYRSGSDISRLNRGAVRLSECDPMVIEVLDRCAEWQDRTAGLFTARQGRRIDPTGLVKGWAVQRAAWMLCGAGSTRHFLSGGGDVQTVGGPWSAGIADPNRRGGVLAAITLTDQAIATSGTTERGAHVINPIDGHAPERLASVSVIAPTLLEADVWATALLAGDDPDLEPLPDDPLVAALAVTGDGLVVRSASWPRERGRSLVA